MMTRMDRPVATMAFLLLAAGDPPVAVADEGVGPGCSHGGFAEDPGQVGFAVPGRALPVPVSQRNQPVFAMFDGLLVTGGHAAFSSLCPW